MRSLFDALRGVRAIKRDCNTVEHALLCVDDLEKCREALQALARIKTRDAALHRVAVAAGKYLQSPTAEAERALRSALGRCSNAD